MKRIVLLLYTRYRKINYYYYYYYLLIQDRFGINKLHLQTSNGWLSVVVDATKLFDDKISCVNMNHDRVFSKNDK